MDAFYSDKNGLGRLPMAPTGRNRIDFWLKGLQTQGNVILALTIREMKIRYGRSSMGYAMAFVSPTLQKGLLIAVMIFAAEKPPIGTSIVLFYWVGLSSYHMFGFVTGKVLGSLKESRKVRVLPSIMPLDYAIMRALLEASTNIIVSACGLVLIYMFDTQQAIPGKPLWVLEAMGLMLMLGVGVGLVNSAIGVFFPTYTLMWKAVSTVLMLTSGLFKIPDSLPYQARQYMLWNPLTHGIELFRMGFYPAYYSNFVDIGYLTKCSCIAMFVGLTVERVLRKRILNHK